ncbi:MAG: histidine kinase N-terminal 7TM domain-containing protein [Dehalococcoidia bacterium]
MEPFIRLNALALSLILPALISGGLAAYAFTRRSVTGSRAFAWLMLSLCIWSFSYGIELSCLSLQAVLICLVPEYLGIASVPVLVLIMTLQYTGLEKSVTTRNVIPLFIIPLITVLMVATNQLHHLYYASASIDISTLFPMLALTRGPWFWIHMIYSYTALIASAVLLIARLGKPGTLFHNQVIAMLIGLSVPFAVNILYIAFGLMPFGHLDLTPFALTITGLVVAWSMFTHGLFDIVPMAYDTVIDSIDDAIVVLDKRNRIVGYNKAAGMILELSVADIGQSAAVAWKDRADLLRLARKDELSGVEIVLCPHNTTSYYEGASYNVEDSHRKTIGKAISLHNITYKKRSEEALKQSEEKYRTLVENINDVIYTLDKEGNITYISPAVERLSKYKVNELLGKSFTTIIFPDDLPGLIRSYNRLISGQMEPYEFRILDKDGSVIYVRTSSQPIYQDGEIVGITALITDITESKKLEQKLLQLATHDILTGLPNRILLMDRFTIAAALARRNKTSLAIMSLDLDRFKSINDTFGHGVGDEVLKTVGLRLAGIIRASDTLARIGGDEFVLVVLETNHTENAAAIARKILDSFMEPLLIEGHSCSLTTSVGIALYPEDGEDLETLLKKSDAAMYFCKEHGRNQFKFYSDSDITMGGDTSNAGPFTD